MMHSQVRELMERLLLYAPFDAAADQFGANLMHDALPPLLGPGQFLLVHTPPPSI